MQANAAQTRRAHCDGAPVHYDRHRSEQTTLHRLVQQHAQSFFAQAEEALGASLPQFVKDEFDAFLECGILAHGFLRLRCADCGHDKLVAFSCKRRGFCPSDRMLFRGYLPIMSGWSMAQLLKTHEIDSASVKPFLLSNAERVKVHAVALVRKHGRPFEYLGAKLRKEDAARKVAERDGITDGLVCVF